MSEKPYDIITTHAERLARDEQERLHQRKLALAEQSSTDNPPEVRIRAWEKLHALRMPGGAAHPVLGVIAQGTGLTLAQIHEEQRARAASHKRKAAPREPAAPTASEDSAAATLASG